MLKFSGVHDTTGRGVGGQYIHNTLESLYRASSPAYLSLFRICLASHTSSTEANYFTCRNRDSAKIGHNKWLLDW